MRLKNSLKRENQTVPVQAIPLVVIQTIGTSIGEASTSATTIASTSTTVSQSTTTIKKLTKAMDGLAIKGK